MVPPSVGCIPVCYLCLISSPLRLQYLRQVVCLCKPRKKRLQLQPLVDNAIRVTTLQKLIQAVRHHLHILFLRIFFLRKKGLQLLFIHPHSFRNQRNLSLIVHRKKLRIKRSETSSRIRCHRKRIKNARYIHIPRVGIHRHTAHRGHRTLHNQIHVPRIVLLYLEDTFPYLPQQVVR